MKTGRPKNLEPRVPSLWSREGKFKTADVWVMPHPIVSDQSLRVLSDTIFNSGRGWEYHLSASIGGTPPINNLFCLGVLDAFGMTKAAEATATKSARHWFQPVETS